MNQTKLTDGTKVYCLNQPEAQVLDSHVEGYFRHGISIKDNDVVIDVGANVGVFGVRVAQKFSSIKVFAFEPIPFIYEVLDKNASVFPGRFLTFQMGLGAGPGTFEFSYFPMCPALSTSHPEAWEQNPEDFKQATYSQLQQLPGVLRYLKYLPRFVSDIMAQVMRSKVIKVQCKVDTLSSIIHQESIERIDLLKIDCEGAEYDVLLGIEETHWALIAKTVIEVYDKDNRLEKIQSLLRQKGFSNIQVEEDEGVKGANLWNVYALR